jgi:hypothetical protein
MTSIHRMLYDPEQDSTPLPQQFDFVERPEAERMAKRAFWRGVVFGGVLTGAAFIGGAAFGEPLSISGTTVTMEPSQEPGAIAVVTMINVSLNGADDNGTYSLAMPGLLVDVIFTWDDGIWGEDSLTVIPPDGIVCRPSSCRMTVPEGLIGRVLLMEWSGM